MRYYFQENAGKHQAINYGVKLAKGDWFFIVDSDDFLSNSAISVIYRYLATIQDDLSFCGIVCNRVYPNGMIIGTPCNYDILDTDFMSYRIKHKIRGDRAEIVRTSVMKEYPFPNFAEEKFCSEALIWRRMAQKYMARYVNEDIYMCEYLSDGLTGMGISKFEQSPNYSALLCLEQIELSGFCLRDRLAAYYFFGDIISCAFIGMKLYNRLGNLSLLASPYIVFVRC